MSFDKKIFAFFQGLLQKGTDGGEFRAHAARQRGMVWVPALMNFVTLLSDISLLSYYASSGALPGRRGSHEGETLVTRGLCPGCTRVEFWLFRKTKGRHSGMILAGIHKNQHLKTWIPAFAGMTV